MNLHFRKRRREKRLGSDSPSWNQLNGSRNLRRKRRRLKRQKKPKLSVARVRHGKTRKNWSSLISRQSIRPILTWLLRKNMLNILAKKRLIMRIDCRSSIESWRTSSEFIKGNFWTLKRIMQLSRGKLCHCNEKLKKQRRKMILIAFLKKSRKLWAMRARQPLSSLAHSVTWPQSSRQLFISCSARTSASIIATVRAAAIMRKARNHLWSRWVSSSSLSARSIWRRKRKRKDQRG